MAQADLLEADTMNIRTVVTCTVAAAIAVAAVYFTTQGVEFTAPTPSAAQAELSVAISPYQDIAMLVNAAPLGLTAKHAVHLNLVTMAWEDITPAISSAGKTVDVGFGSLVEYLTKYSKLNDGSSDPVLFVQPLYVYKGGGFIGLDGKLVPLNASALQDPQAVSSFLKYRIGAQKQSLYEMMIYSLARRAGVATASIKLFDTPMNDGLLALQSGSLDVSAAGLTQLNEARKHGGRMILSMEDTGFADVVGLICRRSVLQGKRAQIESLVQMWFESVDYVTADLAVNSKHSLDYLRKNAATQYSFDEYRAALSQEYLPRSVAELQAGVLAPGSKYEFGRIVREITDYLIENKIVGSRPPVPTPLVVGN
jgi:ABC-type nitrate/sulfonate/bicarbonate transport system substrate-binding protein